MKLGDHNLLTTHEAAKFLGVGIIEIAKLVRGGGVRHVEMRDRTWIYEEDLDKILEGKSLGAENGFDVSERPKCTLTDAVSNTASSTNGRPHS